MPINQKDIARRLGINQATVSRALNGSPLISEEIKNKVIELSKKLGYHPNYLAKSFSSRRSYVISVLKTGNLSLTRLQGHWLQCFHEATRAKGYMLRLDMAKDFERICGEKSADGLIIFGEENIAILGAESDMPMVFTDCDMEVSDSGIAAVITDNAGGSASAVKHLTDLGHRSIAFIALIEGSSISLARHRGYVKALAEGGLPVDDSLTVRVPLWPTDFGHIESLEGLLLDAVHKGATGIVAVNDICAVGAIKLLVRNGYRVPEDISVVGFDDTLLNAMWEPPVTRVAQDVESAAFSVVELLLAMMGGCEPRRIVIPTRLIVDRTTERLKDGAN